MKYIPDYNNPEILKKYAIWYYEKYFPSVEKLRRKLSEKNNNKDIVSSILSEISNIFIEEEVLKSKISFYKDRKSKNYIIQSLTKQFFDKKLIQKLMADEEFDEESLLEKELEKLENLQLSKEKIIQRLLRKWFKYNDFKSKIDL